MSESRTDVRKSGSKLRLRRLFTDYSYFVSFVLILLIAWYVNPNFFVWRNIATIFRQSATTTGMIALGMMMHVGLIGYEPIIKYAKLDEGTGGHISLNNNPDRKVIITLSNAMGVQWESELATLAHEICHKLLYANNCYYPDKGEYNETLTDIATIYAGFGKLTINGCEIQTSRTDPWGTQTTTHYTGYLETHNYITAYKIVCSVNNVPKKEYEAGLSRSKLDILRYYEGMSYLQDIGNDLPSTLKSLRADMLTADSEYLRDIIQVEEYIKELKRDIIQHQKETIKRFDGLPLWSVVHTIYRLIQR